MNKLTNKLTLGIFFSLFIGVATQAVAMMHEDKNDPNHLAAQIAAQINAQKGHTRAIQCLFECAGELDSQEEAFKFLTATTSEEKTALHLAALNEHLEIVEYLIRSFVNETTTRVKISIIREHLTDGNPQGPLTAEEAEELVKISKKHDESGLLLEDFLKQFYPKK